MLYRPYQDIEVSIIGLGGHEFHADGRIKGFQDDFEKAVTAGEIMADFGGENRRRIVERALSAGITLFDVTIDSEKDAMGRVLADQNPQRPICVQTRPEGMCYRYDPANRKMADGRLTAAMVGVADIDQLDNATTVAGDLGLSSSEQDMLEQIRATDLYREGLRKRESRFRPEVG